MLRGPPHKGMSWFTRILAVPFAVNSAALTEILPARRLIDVGVVSWHHRKGAEVVNTDVDTWTFR